MHERPPSRTAQRVAWRRAAHQLLDDPPVFVDPLAIPILGPDAAAALREDPESGETSLAAPYLRAFLAARSRVAEEALAEGVARGVRQYVVLGAGLDTFAYRNPHDGAGVRVFEVDHPATQAWKRERLAAAGLPVPPSLSFVPLDIESDALGPALARAGFDASHATFVAWLGVVPYLERDAVLRTLGFIARETAAGSGVALDYGVPPSSLPLLARVVYESVAARVRAAGEPWRTFFEPAALAGELERLGFDRVADWGEAELNDRYFAGRADRLRVGPAGHITVAWHGVARPVLAGGATASHLPA
jgi:methyltransferase (TIGR00027 family)